MSIKKYFSLKRSSRAGAESFPKLFVEEIDSRDESELGVDPGIPREYLLASKSITRTTNVYSIGEAQSSRFFCTRV